MEKISSRSAGFAQLRSGCFWRTDGSNTARAPVQIPRAAAKTEASCSAPCRFRVAPNVVVAFWVIARGFGFEEPRMLVGGMVHDEVHNDLDAALVALCTQRVPIFHGAELVHDLPVPGDVVAVVVIRRAEHGRATAR